MYRPRPAQRSEASTPALLGKGKNKIVQGSALAQMCLVEDGAQAHWGPRGLGSSTGLQSPGNSRDTPWEGGQGKVGPVPPNPASSQHARAC